MGEAKRRGTLEERIKQERMLRCIHEAAHALFFYNMGGKESIIFVTVDMKDVLNRKDTQVAAHHMMSVEFEQAGGCVAADFAILGERASTEEINIGLFIGAAAEIAILGINKQQAYDHGYSDFKTSSICEEDAKDFCDGIAEILKNHPEQIAGIKKIAEQLYKKTTMSGDEIAQILE